MVEVEGLAALRRDATRDAFDFATVVGALDTHAFVEPAAAGVVVAVRVTNVPTPETDGHVIERVSVRETRILGPGRDGSHGNE